MVDGLGALWVFAHYEPGISELAVRDSRVDCGNFLRLDLAKDGVDLCISDCARTCGHNVAFSVSDGVTPWKEESQKRSLRSRAICSAPDIFMRFLPKIFFMRPRKSGISRQPGGSGRKRRATTRLRLVIWPS